MTSTISRLVRAVYGLLVAVGGVFVRCFGGSGAPESRRARAVGLVACAAVGAGWLALAAGPALALAVHPYLCQITGTSSGSASECHSGGSAAPGGLSRPFGVTISGGDVWATSPGTAAVDEFDSTGAFVTQIPGSGTGYSFHGGADSVARNDTSGFVYLADSGPDTVDVFDNAGAFVTRWNGSTTTSGSFGGGSVSVAVDNSTGGSPGDVYVTDSSHHVIDKLSLGTTAGSQPTAVAFSGSGSYISGSELTGTPSGPFGGLGVNALAVDASGNIWVADQGNGQVDEFSSSGTFVQRITGAGTPTGSFGSVSAVGVDNATGDVYVIDGSNGVVDEFSSSGAFVGQVTGSLTPAGSFSPQGVAVDPSGDVYVTDGSHNVIDKFAAGTVTLPDVSNEAASTIQATGATLTGSVNPDGTTITACRFDYGTSTSYGQSVPCASTPSGSSPVQVSAQIAGLQPNTNYDFRLVVTNSAGSNTGSNVSFRTEPPSFAANVTDTSADLHAQIVPGVVDTTYHFDWGTTTAYGNSIPIPDADIGTGTSAVAVTQGLSGLSTETTYHFRLVASNSDGSIDGPDGTFTTFPSGLPTGLPDGRAYELVTPANNDNGEPFIANGDNGGFEAAAGGDAFGFVSAYGLGVNADGNSYIDSYLAQRGAGGWGSESLIPPQSTNSQSLCGYATVDGYSTDMSKALLQDGFAQTFGCGTDDPPLVSGEPQGVQNLFLNNISSGTYQLISRNPVTGAPANAGIDGASSDLSHVVFDEAAQLTADAPAGDDLYDWSAGKVSLVTEVPATGTSCAGTACTPAAGSFPGGDSTVGGFPTNLAGAFNAVSSDGSRVYFTSGGNLYLRESDSGTVEVDAPASGAPGPGGGGQFQAASADGSTVFFTDGASAGLTSNTVSGSGANLYKYDASSGQLTDLTPSGDAQVQGLSGIGDNGAYLYFVAEGSLAANASAGQPNLYVWHAGTTTFVATLSSDDSSDWVGGLSTGAPSLSARTSSNGEFLAFDSTQSLTGYDNTDPVKNGPDDEIFLYDAASGKLECASCNPSGVPPTAPTSIDRPEFPGTVNATPLYLQHYVSDSGQVFFDTQDSLLPGDTNGGGTDSFTGTTGAPDVYEYEADGTGSCHSTEENGGCLSLISSGTAPDGAYFLDATPDGSNVFFATAQKLVATDTNSAWVIYDARVNGGFPVPAPPQVCTAGATCRPAVAAPAPAPAIGSVTFTGPGNPSSSASAGTTGKVRVLAKAVKGSRFVLTVRVPAAGRITVTAPELKTLRRSVARAGSYKLTLALTANAKRALKHKRKLRLVLHIAFAPHAGRSSSASVAITVKR